MKRALFAMLALALVTSSAAAQRHLREIYPHSGFWISGGLGGGWSDFNGSFGPDGRGGAGYLRMGGTVNPRVLFGGEVIGWWNGRNSDSTRWNIAATALLYPPPLHEWFVKLGFGAATMSTRFRDRSGVGLTFGTGYDFKLGGNFYVTPNVDYLAQFLSNETTGTLLVTLGVTLH